MASRDYTRAEDPSLEQSGEHKDWFEQEVAKSAEDRTAQPCVTIGGHSPFATSLPHATQLRAADRDSVIRQGLEGGSWPAIPAEHAAARRPTSRNAWAHRAIKKKEKDFGLSSPPLDPGTRPDGETGEQTASRQTRFLGGCTGCP